MFALKADTRSGNLGKSVYVVGLNAHDVLQLLAHLLGPRLSAKGSDTQFEFFARPFTFTHGLTQEHSIGRRTAEDRRSEVMHERNLLLGVSARHGNHTGPDVRCTVVSTQSSGEESVAIANLEYILLGCAIGREGTRNGLAPHGQVLTGMQHHYGLARRSAGSVNTHNLAHGHGSQPKGIVVTQV